MKRFSLILGILGIAVVGCTNGAQNDNTANNTGTNTATNASLESQANAPNRKLQTIGVALGDLGNPFYNAVQKGAETEAKKIGRNIRVNAVSSAFDLNQQTNQIENFTAANTDLIIISAVDKKGVKPVIDQARLAGKVVIAVDSAVDADVDAMISYTNWSELILLYLDQNNSLDIGRRNTKKVIVNLLSPLSRYERTDAISSYCLFSCSGN